VAKTTRRAFGDGELSGEGYSEDTKRPYSDLESTRVGREGVRAV
jgi:hypothetical protein